MNYIINTKEYINTGDMRTKYLTPTQVKLSIAKVFVRMAASRSCRDSV